MKAYQILLVEYIFSQDKWEERIICELGSSDSTHPGKVVNPIFTSKIDGTHTLSFDLPLKYLDENTGENVLNELTSFVVNKSKIILKLWKTEEKRNEDLKEYHFVVNERDDNRDKNSINYSFSCSDSFIEELARTGYGLSFSDDVDAENPGLGTIDELTEAILKDSDWEVEDIPNLLEYSTDLRYNIQQARYDTVYISKPSYDVKYIAAPLERYCYLLDKNKSTGPNGEQLYCYEDTRQITSNTVKNLIYNADHDDGSFLDMAGWTSCTVGKDSDELHPGFLMKNYRYTGSGQGEADDDYSLQLINDGTTNRSYLINDTAAETNTMLQANIPYLLSFNFGKSTVGKVVSFSITSKNPLKRENIDLLKSVKNRDYYISLENKSFGTEETESNILVVKPSISIRNPYFIFELANEKGSSFYFYSMKFIEVVGRKIENDEKSEEQNYLDALKELTDGRVLNRKNDAELLGKINIDILGSAPSAYTHKNFQYCYFEGEEKEENLKYYPASKIFEKYTVSDKYKEEINIPALGKPSDTTVVYKDKYGRHYEYYEVPAEHKGDNWETGGGWGPALLSASGNKRRTLIAEKSNRFNLIQELAELFKVWPVFNITRNSDGSLKKTVSYKENAIRQNFSGFHYGVNLEKLGRKLDSEVLVTKMIVEDVPNEHSENGFVTIRTARDNPWGENYFYNFKHYIDQGLLSIINDDGNEKRLQVEIDLSNLYSSVKGKNALIFELNDKLASLKVDHANVIAQLKSIDYALSGIAGRVMSIQADMTNKNISTPDKQKLQQSLNNYEKQKREYQKTREDLGEKERILFEEVKNTELKIENAQKNKEKIINEFETKYLPFIKEGVWTDDSYIDNNAYYLDAQKISNTSAIPQATWSISVIDTSILEEMEDFEVEVGDQTILVDNEFFGIKKDANKNYTFDVLITSIQEHLEEPSKNSLEVKNYFTSFEDLFQRIAATTQSIQLKEQSYDNAAESFTNDHQIDQSILQNTLLKNEMVLANASDNSYTLDSSGLTLQSILNPAKKSRVLAEGIFFSNSSDINGNPEWKTGLTADGINADLLTAGQIDTSLVRILSNGQPSFSWSDLGITAYGSEVSITENSEIGNIIFIGDSYTRNYDYIKRKNNSYVTLNGKYVLKDNITNEKFLHGWPEEFANKIVKPENFIDLGIGSSGFAPAVVWDEKTKGGENFKNALQNSPFLYRNQLRNLTSKIGLLSYETEIGNDIENQRLAYYDGRWNYYFDYKNPSYQKLQNLKNKEYAKDWLNNLSHIIIGGGFNERTYIPELPNTIIYSTLQEIKEEIEKVKLIIGLIQKYRNPDGDSNNTLTVILSSIGRSGSSSLFNKMLERIYKIHEDYWKTPYIEGNYEEDPLFNASLIAEAKEGLKTCVFDFVDISKEWSESGNYVEEEYVHPNLSGIQRIANCLSEKEISEKRENSYSGKTFTRLDSFGLYSLKDSTEDSFNYTIAGNIIQPWYTGLSREECLRRIQKNSLVSLTEKGFTLNVPDSNGSIKLGYEDISLNNHYGLYIKDKDGNLVVQLHNDQDTNRISGWTIGAKTLSHENIVDDKTKRIFYLSNGAKSGSDIALAIGKIPLNGGNDSASFKITADGKLQATEAYITGNGSFSGHITADSGTIGPFRVETQQRDWYMDFKNVIFIGDSYAIAGDNYDGTIQEGWPEAFSNLIDEEKRSHNINEKAEYYKKASGLTGFATGANGRRFQNYIPKNAYNGIIAGWQKNPNKPNEYIYAYYMLDKNEPTKWKTIALTTDFLVPYNEISRTTCFYNPLAKYLFYPTGTEGWYYWDMSTAFPAGLSLAGKKIITFSTGLNSKPSLPMYSYSDGNGGGGFCRRGEKGEYVPYNTANDFLNNAAKKENLYLSETTGGFFIYDSDEEKWSHYAWSEFNCQEKPFKTFFEGEGIIETVEKLDIAPTIQRPPEPTIMWLDTLKNGNNSIGGYWYQDPADNYEWKLCDNVATILNLIGHEGTKYILPNKAGHFVFEDNNWTYQAGMPSSGNSCQLEYNPDRKMDASIQDTFYFHSMTAKFCYTLYEKIGNFTYARQIEHSSPTSFFNDSKNNYISKEIYYENPITKVFFYYDKDNNQWKGSGVANFQNVLPSIRSFSTLLKDVVNNEVTDKNAISHIIVGGGYYDQLVQYGNKTNIEEGIKYFCETAKELLPQAKIIIVEMGHHYNYPTLKDSLYREYSRAISNIDDVRVEDYNISKLWGINNLDYQDDNINPTVRGSHSIAATLKENLAATRGKFYGAIINSKDSSGTKTSLVTSSGFSLESIATGSVALWAGYTGQYNSPIEDYAALGGTGWKTRTPFYITHGGALHARGAYIEGEVYASKGTFNGVINATDGVFNGTVYAKAGQIGDCRIDSTGHLIVKTANIGDISAISAHINELSVSKLSYGTCTSWAGFSNINAMGGKIAGWTIDGTQLKSPGDTSSGIISLQPEMKRVLVTQGGTTALPLKWSYLGITENLNTGSNNFINIPTLSFYNASQFFSGDEGGQWRNVRADLCVLNVFSYKSQSDIQSTPLVLRVQYEQYDYDSQEWTPQIRTWQLTGFYADAYWGS